MDIETIILKGEKLEGVRDYFPPVIYRRLLERTATAVGATVDEKMVGVLAFQQNDEILKMVWIMIAPEYRGQSLAEYMIMELLNSATEMPGVRAVEAEVDPVTDSRRLSRFYRRIGFDEIPNEKKYFAIEVKELEKNALFRNDRQFHDIRTFRELPDLYFHKMQRIFSEEMGFDLDGIQLREDYDLSKSLCLCKDQEIASVILTRVKGERLELSFVYLSPKYPAALMPLILTLYREIKDNSKVITFETINEASLVLAKKIFPEAQCQEYRTMQLVL